MVDGGACATMADNTHALHSAYRGPLVGRPDATESRDSAYDGARIRLFREPLRRGVSGRTRDDGGGGIHGPRSNASRDPGSNLRTCADGAGDLLRDGGEDWGRLRMAAADTRTADPAPRLPNANPHERVRVEGE